MDLVDLEKLARLGESETLEFKTSLASLAKAGETLCGFLNGDGGQVLIGVNAKGEILGQHISDRTLQEVAEVFRKFEPPALLTMTQVHVKDGKDALVISAFPRKSDVPFVFDGRPYQRVGSTTSVMPQQVYQRLLLERNHQNHRWETARAPGYSLKDLDTEEILRTVRLGIQAGRLPEQRDDTLSTTLERFGLMVEGKLLNAAIVLFGTRLLPDFIQCQLRLARFRGIDKSEFIDQKQLQGHLFQLLEEAMLFLRRHLPVSGKVVSDSLIRKDEPLFPIPALREALVNALCHRSYTNPGGAVSVAIFDDRLEIWNDGDLPFGLTPNDLKNNHLSHPRNPLIATIVYYSGLIEKWGRGTQKIINLCVQAGLPEPEFSEQQASVGVSFLLGKSRTPPSVSHDLSERHLLILNILSNAKKDGLSLTEIKEQLPNPPAERTLRKDCQHLKNAGLIELRGATRKAKWYKVWSLD